MTPIPCKNLDYERLFHNCHLTTENGLRYWTRLAATDGEPRYVQFCKKNGRRINDILSCYLAEHDCYEPDEVV